MYCMNLPLISLYVCMLNMCMRLARAAGPLVAWWAVCPGRAADLRQPRSDRKSFLPLLLWTTMQYLMCSSGELLSFDVSYLPTCFISYCTYCKVRFEVLVSRYSYMLCQGNGANPVSCAGGASCFCKTGLQPCLLQVRLGRVSLPSFIFMQPEYLCAVYVCMYVCISKVLIFVMNR